MCNKLHKTTKVTQNTLLPKKCFLPISSLWTSEGSEWNKIACKWKYHSDRDSLFFNQVTSLISQFLYWSKQQIIYLPMSKVKHQIDWNSSLSKSTDSCIPKLTIWEQIAVGKVKQEPRTYKSK